MIKESIRCANCFHINLRNLRKEEEVKRAIYNLFHAETITSSILTIAHKGKNVCRCNAHF